MDRVVQVNKEPLLVGNAASSHADLGLLAVSLFFPG
jgi:hypothetical protein